ncbi:hypothetical protein [Alicyclobacillus tolerans]|uniref:Uncharacterized protein n=1 Tax=Alicyclobacillus tolerans TaxID=90970 RepID=A0ABT9LUH9_9BACL|nr:hypothetical protein [Alicyclobacillus tengchongensis]MDP9727914.1 hypothetical protein [Alicyclobacillus tengchongensis]
MKRYKKWTTAGIALTIVGLLTGCGTGGGVSSGSTPSKNITNTTSTNNTSASTALNNTATSISSTSNASNNSTITGNTVSTANQEDITVRSMYAVVTNGKTYQVYPGRITYDPELNLIHLVVTKQGVVWNPIPQMSGNPNSLMSHPIQPYSLYLNKTNSPSLSTANSKLVYTLPISKIVNGKTLYVYLTHLFNAGGSVIYSINLRGSGMPQPMSSELYVLNLTTNQSVKITSFHATGGDTFSISISDNNIFYKQANAGGSTDMYQYSLSSGSSKRIAWAPNGLTWTNL